MKILMFFVDMLGPEYMYLGNNSNLENEMDRFLTKLGGTFYSNCFTPAPDTPRSSACMWSGEYPKKNGCNSRLKYPGRYLKTDRNLWNELEQQGYQINTYVRKSMNDIGLLPFPYEKRTATGDIYKCTKEFDITEKSITFFYLQDLHLIMDTNGYNIKVFREGTIVVANMIKRIINYFGLDTFDYIFVFSDHGFRTEKKEHLIDRDRVRTLMFIHRRGDKKVTIDYELRSNLDLYPTILEVAEITTDNTIAGCSLLSKGHKHIIVEDHEDFTARLGQTIEHWAIIRRDGIHWLECSGLWEHEKQADNFDEEYYNNEIIEKADDFEENHKMWVILNGYNEMKRDNDFFSDMSTIPVKHKKKKAIKDIRRIIRRLF